MEGQMSLFPEMEEQTPNSCHNCEFYSALVKPRVFSSDICIHGYCFKNMRYNDKGYAVYIPDACCKEHRLLK